eukprot:958695-Pyramimonas_sp.AAC.1
MDVRAMARGRPAMQCHARERTAQHHAMAGQRCAALLRIQGAAERGASRQSLAFSGMSLYRGNSQKI